MADNKDIILECECCGGNYVKLTEGKFKCDHCSNIKYFETTTSSEIVIMLNQAHALRNKYDFDDASEIFRSLIKKDENNPEPYWGVFLSEYGIMHVEDPITKRYMPTCNRASGIPVMDDEFYKKAIELANDSQKEDYRQKAEEIENIRLKIIELSKNESAYDVFICYKRTQSIVNGKETYTEDAINARDLYDMLIQKGYKVFFAEKTLQNVVGSQYEAVIYNALNTSKIMLVVCSSAEYLNSTWVKNEWRRFIKQMSFDETKKLIPIMCGGMKAGSLPDMLRKYQGLELGVNFETNFLNVINRHIGFAKKNNVQRVVIDGKKTIKKSTIEKSTITTRTISNKNENVLVVSDHVQLQNALIYLKEGLYVEAIEEFDRFLDNPNLRPIAEFVLCFINFKVKTRKIKNIKKASPESFSRLCYHYNCQYLSDEEREEFLNKFNACIECADRETADIIFAEVIKEYHANILHKDTLYSALMGWDCSSKKIIQDTAIRTAKYLDDDGDRCLEAIVKYYDPSDVDGYIALMKEIGDARLSEYRAFQIKESDYIKHAFDKILEVDEGNIDTRWKLFLLNLGIANEKSLEYTLLTTFKAESIAEFKEFLSYVPEKSRIEFIDYLVNACIQKICTLSVSDKAKNYAYVKNLDLILNKDKSSNIQKNLTMDMKRKENVNLINDLKKLIKNHVKKGDIKADLFADESLEDLEKVFDDLIKLYSETDNEVLIQRVMAMADELKKNKHFDNAIKYYNIAIAEGKDMHKAYWGIMQCKMKCRNNEDVLKCKTPVRTFSEYNSALGAAGNVDSNIVKDYIQIMTMQANGEKSHKKNAKNKSSKSTFKKEKTKRVRVRKILSWKQKLVIAISVIVIFLAGGLSAHFYAFYNIETYCATKISTLNELESIDGQKGKYCLADDIDLSGVLNFSISSFSGMLFGNGYSIKNYNVSSIGVRTNFGIIEYAENARFQNIKIENVNVDFGTEAENTVTNFGALVGYASDCKIDNVSVSGSIKGEKLTYAGSIVGKAESCTINNCDTTCNIEGLHHIGGIAGYMGSGNDWDKTDSIITNCTNNAEYVIATGYNKDSETLVGGLLGYCYKTLVKNLSNFANVENKSTGQSTGGISGYLIIGPDEVNQLTNSGDIISGGKWVGGIVGNISYFGSYELTCFDCINYGKVEGACVVGGVFGRSTVNVSDIHNKGESVTATGKNSDSSTALGGVIGLLYGKSINDATNSAKIIYKGSGLYVGGIIGDYNCQSNSFNVSGLRNYGRFIFEGELSGLNSVGGLMGKMYIAEGYKLTLSYCSNEVSIDVNVNNVGGAVGFAEGAQPWYAKYSYTNVRYGSIVFVNFEMNGDVKGADYVGGIVGKAYIGACTYDTSMVAGDVTSYLDSPEYVNPEVGRFRNG